MDVVLEINQSLWKCEFCVLWHNLTPRHQTRHLQIVYRTYNKSVNKLMMHDIHFVIDLSFFAFIYIYLRLCASLYVVCGWLHSPCAFPVGCSPFLARSFTSLNIFFSLLLFSHSAGHCLRFLFCLAWRYQNITIRNIMEFFYKERIRK